MLLHGKPARGKELATFMAAVQRGTNTAEAWRQAFGGSDFDRDLRNYIQPYEFKAYRAKFEEAVARVDAAARPMAQPEVSAFLAGLRLRQQRTDEAALLADAALKSESAHAHVNVAKAQVDLAKGNRDAAAARLTAMEPSDDWLVRYMAGTTLTESIDRETDVPADRLAAARAHFAAVAKVREVPNALAAQVRLDFVGRNRPNAESRANIERARILAPGRADYAIIHAHVLTELGDFALARAVLGPMLSPSAQPHVRTSATSLMEYVNQVEAFRQRQSAAIGQTQQAVPGRSREDAPGSAAGKAGVQPAFRVVQDGEQRMEGTLERISCLAGGAVSFHIRSAAGAEVFHAPKVEAVDFSKHRDDLPDRIGCGPLEEPWRVYVTWRPGATGIRTVVAIEVLPK